MPKKIRLLALKTLLSAKLSEGRIIIVDNDDIPEKRTRHVSEMLSNFSEVDRYLYVTGHINEDFKVACKNIHRIKYTTFDEVTLTDILKADKIMMNLDGILNLMRYIHEQTVLLHKPRAIKFEAELTTQIERAKDLKRGKVPVEKVVAFDAASL
jgi:hypothetical protein